MGQYEMQDRLAADSKSPAAHALAELVDEVLQSWEKKVRSKIAAAKHLSHPILIDTAPAFLANLINALSTDRPQKAATEMSSVPREHGSERARLSQYSPDQLILEYQLLRDTVFETLERKVDLTDRERSIIQTCFDFGVCEAMIAFFLVHSKIREQFMATLSHDLRNPIGAGKMAADLILLNLQRDHWQEHRDDIRALAGRIINNMKRADRMIQNLLDATSIRMGDRMQLNISRQEIWPVVKEVLAEVSRDDFTRVRIDGSAPWGFWDGDALRRVVENLLANAFKYGKPDTPVTIRISSREDRMVLQVHNFGLPIPIEEQEQLFQAFQRADSAKISGKMGWGLGLALVREVAEAHGGSVGVESSAENGTTFTFDIPQDARPYQDAPVV
jgi:signal transduction histidine kinase